MKEVEEVVHVPTRDLAEEVLRVAKENGLMNNLDLGSLNPYYNNTCFELKKVSDYGVIEFYKKQGYKILTTHKFLDRYKDSELDKLRKENESLKKQLQEISCNPKIGDICIMYKTSSSHFIISKLTHAAYDTKFLYKGYNTDYFDNCIKATPENIQAKINELKND